MATSVKQRKTSHTARAETGDRGESYWDWLQREIKDKIIMMVARQIHREQWKEI